MLKDEFLKLITDIGQCEDDVERRNMLATLSEEVTKDYDTLDTLTSDNETLKTEREKLRQANMELFLKVGHVKDPNKTKEDETGIKENENEKKSFNDLFNEKGDLK